MIHELNLLEHFHKCESRNCSQTGCNGTWHTASPDLAGLALTVQEHTCVFNPANRGRGALADKIRCSWRSFASIWYRNKGWPVNGINKTGHCVYVSKRERERRKGMLNVLMLQLLLCVILYCVSLHVNKTAQTRGDTFLFKFKPSILNSFNLYVTSLCANVGYWWWLDRGWNQGLLKLIGDEFIFGMDSFCFCNTINACANCHANTAANDQQMSEGSRPEWYRNNNNLLTHLEVQVWGKVKSKLLLSM